MKKIVRKLRILHALQIAVYYSYPKTDNALDTKVELEFIKNIQINELKNIYAVESIIELLGYNTDPFLDKLGNFFGKVLRFSFSFLSRKNITKLLIYKKIEFYKAYLNLSLDIADMGRVNLADKLSQIKENEFDYLKVAQFFLKYPEILSNIY